MFELPEVETFRRDLEREVIGKKVKSVDAESMSLLSSYKNRKGFTAPLDGVKMTGVERIGLRILITLDTEDVLVIDMAKSMRPQRATNKEAVADGTEVVITFTQHGQLRFVDPKGKGDLRIIAAEDVEEATADMAVLGLDPVAEPLSWTHFGELLRHHDTALKTFLTDERIIIGIGTMYTDEILFTSGLKYDRSSSSLSSQEVRRLYRALVETLHDAMKYRGTSTDKNNYLDLFSEPGTYQEHLQVFEREGELSPRSRAPIMKTKFNGSVTYYCETQV